MEKSAGAIIFRKERGKIYYLLLKYASSKSIKKTYWGFPKGRIEKGEKTVATIRREVKEETGLKDIKFLKGFKKIDRYFFKREGKTIFKVVFYLLAETKTKKVTLSFEHLDYQWLPFELAIKKLTFKSAKELLKAANDYLCNLNEKKKIIKFSK
jgi:8-oxo-dGTP pyrophosphatase MutT (NUDIX family)